MPPKKCKKGDRQCEARVPVGKEKPYEGAKFRLLEGQCQRVCEDPDSDLCKICTHREAANMETEAPTAWAGRVGGPFPKQSLHYYGTEWNIAERERNAKKGDKRTSIRKKASSNMNAEETKKWHGFVNPPPTQSLHYPDSEGNTKKGVTGAKKTTIRKKKAPVKAKTPTPPPSSSSSSSSVSGSSSSDSSSSSSGSSSSDSSSKIRNSKGRFLRASPAVAPKRASDSFASVSPSASSSKSRNAKGRFLASAASSSSKKSRKSNRSGFGARPLSSSEKRRRATQRRSKRPPIYIPASVAPPPSVAARPPPAPRPVSNSPISQISSSPGPRLPSPRANPASASPPRPAKPTYSEGWGTPLSSDTKGSAKGKATRQRILDDLAADPNLVGPIGDIDPELQ